MVDIILQANYTLFLLLIDEDTDNMYALRYP